MSLGRVFQKVEAATENERRPTVDRRYERVDFFGTLCITFIYWTRCDILPGRGVYCGLGLRACSWPGRSQVITGPGVTYYLDGAHTVDSIQVRCCFTCSVNCLLLFFCVEYTDAVVTAANCSVVATRDSSCLQCFDAVG